MEVPLKSKLGRNDKCWCGSGKKFKYCHLNREIQAQPGIQETLQRFHRVYEKGRCVHLEASPQTCSPKIISAHTIQRNGGLSIIARNGHVYNLLKHGSMFEDSTWDTNSGVNKVGIKEASTFKGFCSKHDNELFAPVEKEPFVGTTEQIALLGYRAVCYELLMKEYLLRVDELFKDMDKGQPPPVQQFHQEALFYRDSGAEKAIEEIVLQKRRYEKMIFSKNYTNLAHYVVFFTSIPEVMCSGVTQGTHDFLGNKIAELGHLSASADWQTLSLIATDDGGAAVFTWLADRNRSHNVMMSLNGLPEADQPHAIVRFVFEFFENTYFSPEWWDGLDKQVQVRLKERQLREIVGPWGENEHPRPDNCLLDDGVRAVHWTVRSRLTSLPGRQRIGVNQVATRTEVTGER